MKPALPVGKPAMAPAVPGTPTSRGGGARASAVVAFGRSHAFLETA